MPVHDIDGPLREVARLVAAVRARGVMLWLESGRLRYKAPKGTLTGEEIKSLAARSDQITLLLDDVDTWRTPPFDRGFREAGIHAPLAFTQWRHWTLSRLEERNSFRHLASATRLRGRVDIAALRQTYDEVVARHEALRTRFVIKDGIPIQEITRSINHRLIVEDLKCAPPGTEQATLLQVIDRVILTPIRVTEGPLFSVVLVALGDADHVLIIAMEHIISDAFSLNLVRRDLLQIYSDRVTRRPSSVPAVTIQFPEYARTQRQSHRLWVDRHAAYWNEQLRDWDQMKLPADVLDGDRSGWAAVPIRVTKQLKAELSSWARSRGTTMVMSALAAYGAALLRWCDTRDVLVRYQTGGRTDARLMNTVGYLAAVLPLRIRMHQGGTFLDLLDLVTRLYCEAMEHGDVSQIDGLLPSTGSQVACGFNWIPAAPQPSQALPDLTIEVSDVPFVNPVWKTYDGDGFPFVLLYESDEQIDGAVHFPRRRFCVQTMERFAGNFLMCLRTLLRRPDMRLDALSFL